MRHTTLPGPPPGVRLERAHWAAGRVVAGVDEVGRGAWAGPVSVGVVALDPSRRVHGLRDSKMLTPAQRERAAQRLHTAALALAVGHATSTEIDEVGLSEALRRATRRAVEALGVRPDVLLVDGNWDFATGLAPTTTTLVRGDRRSSSIAAASIVAKVTRDRMLVDADPQHPAYAFASNKGYGSPAHRRALAVHGPCGLHRASWAPISGLVAESRALPSSGGPRSTSAR
ncbi:MAG: ribonuclease HII [Nitriliruptoraceae bacterium]